MSESLKEVEIHSRKLSKVLSSIMGGDGRQVRLAAGESEHERDRVRFWPSNMERSKCMFTIGAGGAGAGVLVVS